MSSETATLPEITEPSARWRITHFLLTNRFLAAGLLLIATIGLFALIGPVLVNRDHARIAAFETKLKPSTEHLFGTTTQGRDVFTVLVLGTPNTIKIGIIAGLVGLAVGTFLGLVAGYFGGILDTVIRLLSDTLIIIPGIAILVLVAVNVREMSVMLMALIVASLAWMGTTRAIRAQVLSLRERAYVDVAKLNGLSGLEIVVKEILPNLLPYVAASFVGAVAGAMLASIGLEALGLGPQNSFTLGTMIYWGQFYGAVIRSMWWWWAPPIVMIVIIFASLLLTSAGMDQIVNVRLKRTV